MGRPAAKKGDKIVSATPGDIHIVMVPSPGGPIPTPLPHPCKSDLKMKLAKQVNVQGKPGAMKGSKSKHMPPHFPTPPGVRSSGRPRTRRRCSPPPRTSTTRAAVRPCWATPA